MGLQIDFFKSAEMPLQAFHSYQAKCQQLIIQDKINKLGIMKN